jgi:hypothetical protein
MENGKWKMENGKLGGFWSFSEFSIPNLKN